MTRAGVRAWLGVAAVLMLAGGLAADTSPFIIEAGQPRAQIVVAPSAPRTVTLAAQELQVTLQRMTGATLPIAPRADPVWPVHLYVGRNPDHESGRLPVADLKHGAYRIVSGSNWLALLGNDQDYIPREPWGHNSRDAQRVLGEWDAITGEAFGNPYVSLWRKVDAESGLWEFDLDNAGSFNAVTRFLMDLGVRWYMPGELGEFVPRRDSIPLPQLDLTVKPDFALRNIYQMGANFFTGRREEMLWQLRLGTNQGQDLVAFGPNVAVAHGIKHVVARDEFQKAHPDAYRMLGGARQPEAGVPCLSSQELLDANVRFLRAWFDHYDVPMASVMPTDGFTAICECERCADQATPQRGRRGSLSDYVWGYVARVAQELLKTHPDRKIHCLAYTTYQLPPLGIDKLPPNVVVGIAQNRSAFRDAELKQLQDDLRAGWRRKITSGVPLYQYEYYLQEWPSRPWQGLPVLYPRMIVDDLRSLKGISMGEYIEGYRPREPQPTTLFNIYITARYFWDVNQDLDAIQDEYFRLMFGAASSPMRQFYALAEARWFQLGVDDVERLMAMLDESRRLAGESDEGRRVALIRQAMEPGLTRQAAILGRPDRLPLPRIDVAGLDPSAEAALLPQRSLRSIQGDGSPLIAGASATLAWTGTSLLIRVSCEEPDMGSLRQFAQSRHDAAIFRDDVVNIVIAQPDGNYHELLINPAGVWAGLDRSKQGLDGLGWNPPLEIVCTRGADRWAIEVTIPASSLGLPPPDESHPWRLNVGRVRPRHLQRELSSLIPTGQESLGVPDRMVEVYLSQER